ncbi:hypothetical protein LOZ12_002730 [Ophidiomyces ophidiicola]|uniref:Uncharacterized protein n=1 Tax=Ophidiomyces ophidiicola TaxID=1387563 RepID=A0ACB8UQU1_9EURO|nr:uncharacterized protein LOZ57_004774 [Ophidiomyces ophidiicola]KAI1921562.1 hypothetical protein LOZ64_001544 [Ophidiomyces ophidiicola]KAI1944416.1 hypothetical protein LOZ57_004774 [Ophidiomyces ophidiicola]KAI1949007.1 hypothetical protein LOZ62_002375 [Ophidiomyces ophidiicola]KAI1958706.1 hypothetical protein LOZ59_003390 [Ophidiomyces ophidiicola]KAI1970205.1 hypothetical protein LOZ56_003866 [Ophidiomyces ophidiicola]
MIIFRSKTASKTFFESTAPQHATNIVVGSLEPLDTSVTLTSGTLSRRSRSRGTVRSFLRRSGSKLLSMLKFRSSGGCIDDRPLPILSAEGVDQESAVSNQDSPSCVLCEELPTPDTFPSVPEKCSISLKLLQTPVYSSRNSNAHTNKNRSDCNRINLEDAKDNLEKYVTRRHSSPGLACLLRHKPTTIFGPPTVIHRAKMSQRPSICGFSFTSPSAVAPNLQNLGDNAQDDSDSSSLTRTATNSSPRSQSTNPTSDGGPLTPPPKSDKNNGASSSDSNVSKDEASQPDEVVPSIVTVEAAAAAKVYFETYFNELLSGESPRSQRQHELEEKLYMLQLNSEQYMRAKRAWYRQENDHLRQDRALKSWSNSPRLRESMSIAGYEVIKVLGKGSFGVVRLVRETLAPQETPQGSDCFGEQSHGTLETLKSAIDGARYSRRKPLCHTSKEVYAMKVIRKSDMIRNCQEGHLRAERDFLVASAKSRWIVPLVASFQDVHNLYLVMDYMIGGDFLSLLIRKNILSEDVTRWYVAEMILCVEETHRLRWIHRDVKPDNFLISASGHLKISDFGLAFDGHWSHDQTYYMNQRQSLMSKLGILVQGDHKDRKAAEKAAQKATAAASSSEYEKGELEKDLRQGPFIPSPGPNDDIIRWRNRKERRKLARSVVGTSQYMAPEVIRAEPYDGRCDWWSVGVILYECLYGFTPFSGKSRDDTKKKILNHYQSLYFPTDRSSDRLVSDDAVDLIIRMLQEKEYRICSEKYMLNDFVHSGRIPGELIDYPADRTHKNYRGYYVYPDDASDIKNHPFFRNTRWDEILYRAPPFIPKVKGWEDTRYFDCEHISDVQEKSSEEAPRADEIRSQEKKASKHDKSQLDGPSGECNSRDRSKNVTHGVTTSVQNKPQKKRRGWKRARDKILRDEQTGKIALDMRKRNAFLGYSYRRPKDVLLAVELDPHRPLTRAR